MVASHVPPAGDLALNPGVCLDWESNWQPFGSQARHESTELHQPGLRLYLLRPFVGLILVHPSVTEHVRFPDGEFSGGNKVIFVDFLYQEV